MDLPAGDAPLLKGGDGGSVSIDSRDKVVTICQTNWEAKI